MATLDSDSEDVGDVLRDNSNLSDSSTPNESDDYALAKLWQEQERAMLYVRSSHGEIATAEGQEEEVPSEEGSSVGDEEAGDPDEALARHLQQEEELAHQQRLMELAGVHGDEGEFSDEDNGYVTEDSVDPDDMTYEELRALGDSVGTVSRGLPQSTIDGLPTARFLAPGIVDTGDKGIALAAASGEQGADEEQCAVCRMEFERGEDVKIVPCGHVYHPPCIGAWLLINKVCPICGQEVTAPAQPTEDTPEEEGSAARAVLQ